MFRTMGPRHRGRGNIERSDRDLRRQALQWGRVLKDLGVDTLFIEPGSPWENGYVESFNSRMRDELLDGELFLHIDEMKYVVERWRMDYDHYRPHSSLGYMTPAGFAELCRQAGYIRPYTPVFDGVQGCGILSWALDFKKGADHLIRGQVSSSYAGDS